MPLSLTIKQVTLNRGGRRILQDVSCTVPAGEALLLTGPNGVGKTSLLRAIAGFIAVEAGRIELAGGDPEKPLIEQAHYLGINDAVKPALTVRENLAFWADYLAGASHGLDAALQTMGIAQLAHVPAGYLSAGQRRRLGLARLLVADRPLWLLDEPTVSLDTSGAALVARLVTEHLSGGGIAIAATHLPLGIENARTLTLAPVGVEEEVE